MLVQSKGHKAFIGEYEYFVHEVDGSLYMAPTSNPIDTLGYRQGARWECYASNVTNRLAIIQSNYDKYYA